MQPMLSVGKLMGAGRRSGAAVLPSLYLGAVATRGYMIAAALTNTTRQIMAQRGHIARADITTPRVVLTNFYIESTNFTEATLGSAFSVDVSIQYPIGVGSWQSFKFSGVNTGICADGGELVSDALTLETPIPKGSSFLIRTWKRFDSAGCLYTAMAQNTSLNDLCTAGATTPNCCDGTAFTNLDPTIQDGVTAVIDMTREPSAFVFGTSRTAAQSTDTPNAAGDVGEICRMIGGTVGYINVARGSDRLFSNVAGFTKRASLAKYCSYAISDHGTNDETNSRTLAQIQADMATISALLRPIVQDGRLYWDTPCPRTNGSNTAVATGETIRRQRDTYIRFGAGGSIDDYDDVRPTLEDMTAPGLWSSASWSDDFIHQNQTGNLHTKSLVAVPTGMLSRTPVSSGLLMPSRRLIDRMSSTPSGARQALIDALMHAILDSGAYMKLDAFYALCAADAQAAGLNWMNPGFPMVPVASPTFTADQGYQSDGVSSYLNTKYNPGTDGTFFSQNSAHIGATAVTNDNATSLEFGFSNASNPAITGGFRNSSDLAVMAVNHSTASLDASVSQTDSRFVLIASRTGGSVADTYKNGVSIATSAVAATGIPNGEIYVCGRNNAGVIGPGSKRLAHFQIGGALDATQAATVSAAVKAYVNGCTPGLLP